MAVLATACVLLALIYHDTIGEWVIWLVDNDGEAHSAIVLNITLTIVTIAALPLALWYFAIADRQYEAAMLQSKSAIPQLNTGIPQFNTDIFSLQIKRFQQGAEMLEGPQMLERCSGISILEQLAKENVAAYHLLIVRIFCLWMRNPPEHNNEEIEFAENEQLLDKGSRRRIPALRNDMQAIICALENRSDEGRAVEKEQDFILDFSWCILARAKFSKGDWSSIWLESTDLSNALIEDCDMKESLMLGTCLAGAEIFRSNLSKAYLFRGNLERVKLMAVDLSGSNMESCNLNGAILDGVDLTGVSFRNADLSGAKIIDVDFLDADLTGTDFSGAELINVKNLTKRQMAKSVGKPDKLPDLPD